MKMIIVLVATLAAFAPAARAQTASTEAAERRSTLVAWIMRGVGSVHDAADLKKSHVALMLGDWPSKGCVKSMTMKGEASLQYVETVASLPRLAAEWRRREALLDQAKALAAITGGGEEIEMSLGRLSGNMASAAVDYALAGRRAADLKALLFDAKWAFMIEGTVGLEAVWGVDVAVDR